MNEDTARTISLGGSVAAALAASACCVGPLVFALLGLGGAGALVALEPYRPLFTALTLGLLGVGYYLTYRPARARAEGASQAPEDCGCEQPRTHRAGRRMLWLATAMVGLALGFPYLTPYLF